MTRTALRRAVRPYRDAIVAWFAHNDQSLRLPQALSRAGFKRLPLTDAGCERNVLLGPGLVVKNDTFFSLRRPVTHRRYRRKFFAPTTVIAPGLIAQSRGRPIAKCRGRRWKNTRETYYEIASHVEIFYDLYDTHEGNFAVFPDRTVRCIDF